MQGVGGRSVLRRLSEAASEHPVQLASACLFIKYAIADTIVQTATSATSSSPSSSSPSSKIDALQLNTDHPQTNAETNGSVRRAGGSEEQGGSRIGGIPPIRGWISAQENRGLGNTTYEKMTLTEREKDNKAKTEQANYVLETEKSLKGDTCTQQLTPPSGTPLDMHRVGLFALFGGYYGAVNYFVFRFLAAVPWPGGRLAGAVGMAIADSVIHVPFVLMPQFYVVKELLHAPESLLDMCAAPEQLVTHVSRGLSTYIAHLWPDFQASVAIFIPIDLCMFYFLPLHLQTPFLAVVGLVYPIILSFRRNGQREREDVAETIAPSSINVDTCTGGGAELSTTGRIGTS